MEYFYYLFSIKETSYNIWTEDNGLTSGFYILLIVTFFVSAIYYLYFARKYITYAKMKVWWLFVIINSIIIFLLSTFIIGYYIFPYDDLQTIPGEVYLFGILNSTIYAGILFLLFSLFWNNFSVNPRYIPFNLFKK